MHGWGKGKKPTRCALSRQVLFASQWDISSQSRLLMHHCVCDERIWTSLNQKMSNRPISFSSIHCIVPLLFRIMELILPRVESIHPTKRQKTWAMENLTQPNSASQRMARCDIDPF